MLNLFGDRFLILFAGNLQRRMKRTILNVKDQNLEATQQGAFESVEPISEEVHDENLAEVNRFLNEDDQNKKNDIER